MAEKSFGSRSSFRSIIFMLLAFLAIPFPVLAQNNEITLSLGGIPSQSRSFKTRHWDRPKFHPMSVWDPTTAIVF
jgi:hypothetical protein